MTGWANPALPYHGPHAILDRDELIAIRREIVKQASNDATLTKVVHKIDAALNSDPKFRLPDHTD